MKKSFRAFFFAALTAVSLQCAAGEMTYKADDNGNVIYTLMLEELPHSASDVYGAAKKYFDSAYKHTKYKITYDSAEDGIVIGTGSFQQFFQGGNVVKVITFNVDFQLRVDAKDNRARLQLIAKDYILSTLNDLSANEKTSVSIVTVAPIAENKDNKKLYKNAFDAMSELVAKTMNEAAESIRSYTPSVRVSKEDW